MLLGSILLLKYGYKWRHICLYVRTTIEAKHVIKYYHSFCSCAWAGHIRFDPWSDVQDTKLAIDYETPRWLM